MWGEAVLTAEHARYRSIQYAEMIRREVVATRQNVAEVDWAERVPALIERALDHGNQSGLVGDQQLGGAPQVTVGESSDRGVEADGCHVALDLVHLAAATPKVLRLGGRADRHAATDLRTRQDTGSSACGQLGVTFIDRSAERVQ
jgi:hypothetical protein